jgi:hypothetical protein
LPRDGRPAPAILLADAARAVLELLVARTRLGQLDTRAAQLPLGVQSPHGRELDTIARVRFVIPRVAARLPFRSDCLVQAIAAQRWLRRSGIASQLHFGVPRDKPATFEAHAWLTAGEIVVTGGDVSGYVPLVRRQATDAS